MNVFINILNIYKMSGTNIYSTNCLYYFKKHYLLLPGRLVPVLFCFMYKLMSCLRSQCSRDFLTLGVNNLIIKKRWTRSDRNMKLVSTKLFCLNHCKVLRLHSRVISWLGLHYCSVTIQHKNV